jgi:PHD/YefM family antitoxin component YafN of YafNO toxin-antitoxin module
MKPRTTTKHGSRMMVTTSSEFYRRIGYYQDRALVEPIMVTRYGRNCVVLIPADEYHRLKALDPETASSSPPGSKPIVDSLSANHARDDG